MVASKPFITGTLLAGLMVRFPISVPWRKEDGSIRPPCSPRRIIIAFLISFSLFMTAPAHGAALTVGPGGSIQAAINSAAGGETVVVEAGVYQEKLIVDKGITLLGIGRPLIDAGGAGSAVTLRAEGSRVAGFQIRGSGPDERDAGIRVLADNCTVEDNLVEENRIGILLQNVRGGVVKKNSVEGNGVGILLETGSENEIVSNRIVENGEGIHITRHNVSESIKASDSGGVSIKYRPKTEASILEVSKIGFAGGLKENRIFGNELLNNGVNARDDGENLWDDGKTGNHHDDFDSMEEGCRDRDRDGICDSPLKIPGGHSVDRYPIATEEAILRYRAVSGDLELILYRSTFSPGQEIPLGFRAPESFSGQAVLVIPASGLVDEASGTGEGADPEETAVSSQILEGEKGTVAFAAPKEEGAYAFLMLDGSGDRILSLSFAVAIPELFAIAASAATCDIVNVTFRGAPGFEGDWIGLFAAGSADDAPISRKYLDGESEGIRSFAMPSSAGIYDFRLFEDGGRTSIAKSSAVEVKSSAGVRIRASPAAARPGEAITVSFWGAKPASAIGMYEMTSPDKFMLAMQWTSGRSCGTMTFAAPRSPGRYDFRLFEDNVHRKHMGASNVVVVG
jgi:parallel beta-helix repeat protein